MLPEVVKCVENSRDRISAIFTREGLKVIAQLN